MKAVLPLVLLVLAHLNAGAAQQPHRVPRLAFVSIGSEQSEVRIEAFRQGLQDLGYTEGKNLLVEYRYLHGDRARIPTVVSELIELKVDVIISGTPPVMRALKQATKTVPIVMVTTQDPVAAGYVNSLAQPGGNITGLTRMTRDLSEKRLELLKEVFPALSRVGILWNAEGSDAGFAIGFKRYEAAAQILKMKLTSLGVRGPIPDFDGAFRAAIKDRVHALITLSNLVLDPYTKRIAELATKNRLPSMGETTLYVEDGGLMSYSPDDRALYARAAVFVDKILKGTKPADIPVEQPTKFELVINLKTAKQIGVTIPPLLLAKADRVIK
jgi:putative tryptophan/tyrosine transport system substrate-binding protein